MGTAMNQLDGKTLCGGSVWSSPTHAICMVSLAGNDQLMLVSDPRQQGSLALVQAGGKWTWTRDELRAKFETERSDAFGRGWTYVGQMHELLAAGRIW